MKCRRTSAAIAALTAAAVVASSPGAWAADVKGSLVKATKTSEWTTPSPDPSGIGYNENSKRFLISDGEVEEMTIYKGVNLYDADTSGALVGTAVTLPWSSEPTGIAVNPSNGQIYISDDDKRSVFVLDSLSDTSPGVIEKAKFTAHGVDPDLEGVGYDSKRNEILLANGERGAGFWRVKPGTDGQFGTGDDVVAPKILVADAVDPEGIAYDKVRDTVVMVDGSANRIFEMNATGGMLNRIDISGMGMNAAAGIEVAPASNGSTARHYYIVDRGVDNNSDPDENDGVLYEVSAPLGDAGANQPPTANAGADKVATVGDTVTLAGSGTDIEPGALTYSWKRQSGPLGVTLGTPNAATTTATFTEAGTFVLRLTVTDSGGLASSDDVTVTVAEAGGAISVDRPALASGDDAMEGSATGGKFVDVGSKQNALGSRQPASGSAYPVLTGLRFPNIPVPKGGTIQSAKIQFKVDEVTTGAASLTIKGEATDNAAVFGGSGNISARTTTAASVPWAPADWTTIGSTGPEALTPDLKAILQEIVDRPGWASGNAVALTVSGTGRRAAKSVDAGAAHAPVLRIQYTTGGTTPVENKAPMVSIAPVAPVKLPAAATLDATVTDDGLPQPPGAVTVKWTVVSGPEGGNATFAADTAVDTTATFTKAGTYVLRLTASDSVLTRTAEVTVTVEDAANAAPTVDAGADQTVTLPAGATLKGTVSDDGKPAGKTLTTMWSMASGDGTVEFPGGASKLETTATFSVAGTYVLRLTADDGALTAFDEVTVTVKAASTTPGGGGSTPPPSGGGGSTPPPSGGGGSEAPAIDEVSLRADQRVALVGAAVTLTGVVEADDQPVAGTTVQLSVMRSPSGSLEPLGTAVTDSSGAFRYVDRPQTGSWYVAKAGGKVSNVVAVQVRPHLTAAVTDKKVMVGSPTTITGHVTPAFQGQQLLLQQRVRDAWELVASTRLAAGAKVAYAFEVTPQRSGLTRYRVVSPAQGGWTQAVAGNLRVKAYKAKIKRVNGKRGVIVVRNNGRVAIQLAGWTLVDRRTGSEIALSQRMLRPGRIVRIRPGGGQVWGAHGVAELRDARLRLADRLRF